MQATATVTSTLSGSLEFNTPLTPSNVNKYYVILQEVAITPLVQVDVSLLDIINENKIAPINLATCVDNRVILYFT